MQTFVCALTFRYVCVSIKQTLVAEPACLLLSMNSVRMPVGREKGEHVKQRSTPEIGGSRLTPPRVSEKIVLCASMLSILHRRGAETLAKMGVACPTIALLGSQLAKCENRFSNGILAQ